MAIYLKIDGIDGDVTAAGHEAWVECDSMDWHINRNLSTKPGQGKDRESTTPVISEITLTTKMDKTSPLFFAESCVGQGKTAQIHLVQTTPEGIETYMEYTLTNTLISSYNVMSQGDRPTESISLNFTKVEMKYTSWDEAHQPEGSVPSGYDLATGVRL